MHIHLSHFEKFLPTRLLGPTRLLDFKIISHLHCYLDSTLIRHHRVYRFFHQWIQSRLPLRCLVIGWKSSKKSKFWPTMVRLYDLQRKKTKWTRLEVGYLVRSEKSTVRNAAIISCRIALCTWVKNFNLFKNLFLATLARSCFIKIFFKARTAAGSL